MVYLVVAQLVIQMVEQKVFLLVVAMAVWKEFQLVVCWADESENNRVDEMVILRVDKKAVLKVVWSALIMVAKLVEQMAGLTVASMEKNQVGLKGFGMALRMESLMD